MRRGMRVANGEAERCERHERCDADRVPREAEAAAGELHARWGCHDPRIRPLAKPALRRV